jgi:hypothetical protein
MKSNKTGYKGVEKTVEIAFFFITEYNPGMIHKKL